MTQRFGPLTADEWGDDEYATFGVLLGIAGDEVPRAGTGEKYDPLNFPVMGMLAHHPAMAKGFLRFNNQLLFGGELSPRLRELAILRVALTLRSPFEYGEHVRIALDNGVTPAEVDAVGAGNDHFVGVDRLVLEAVDELLAERRLGDRWDGLLAELGKHAAIEVIFVVGAYSTLAMAFDTWGLPPSAGSAPLP